MRGQLGTQQKTLSKILSLLTFSPAPHKNFYVKKNGKSSSLKRSDVHSVRAHFGKYDISKFKRRHIYWASSLAGCASLSWFILESLAAFRIF